MMKHWLKCSYLSDEIVQREREERERSVICWTVLNRLTGGHHIYVEYCSLLLATWYLLHTCQTNRYDVKAIILDVDYGNISVTMRVFRKINFGLCINDALLWQRLRTPYGNSSQLWQFKVFKLYGSEHTWPWYYIVTPDAVNVWYMVIASVVD